MIELEHVSKFYGKGRATKCVLDDVSTRFERGQSIGILGANGSGKSTLLRIIAGTECATSGQIRRHSKLSFRLGLSGSFNGSLTGEENLRFVSRIYGRDTHEVLNYVEHFAELGDDLYKPTRTYSDGMRARLAFGLSLALEFDVYLIDESTAVGDARFQKRCHEELTKRLGYTDVIMVAHSPTTLAKYCTHAAILHRGKLSHILPLGEALPYYHQLLGA